MKFWSRIVMAAAGVAFAVSAVAAHASPAAAPPANLAVAAHVKGTPTPKPPPGPPRSLAATAGDHQVTLTWIPPQGAASIVGYTVTTSPPDFITTFTPNLTLTATGLTNGTLYTFAVQATANGSTYGPAARVTATPHVFPPGPPNNLGAAQGPGQGQMTVSWTPPTSSGSSAIAHYTITISPGGISHQTPDATTTTYLASGLADNITYTFAVTATNAEGGTGPAAVVYAPLPASATIGLQPAAGEATVSITVTGQLFLKNESVTLYWDDPSHVAGSVVTDANGAFTQVVKPFAGDKPGVHRLCASVPPKPCGNFSLQAPPSPTPTPPASPSPPESPSPTASDTSQASAARVGGGTGWLSVVTRPPFVFLPIAAILGLLGLIAYWVLTTRRRPLPPSAPASVVHRATRPDYMAPFPTTVRPPVAPIATAPPSPPQPQSQPSMPPAVPPPLPAAGIPPAAPPPTTPPPAPPREVEWPAPPSPPAAADEPPDLPQPSD